MKSWSLLRALGPLDLRNISRDGMLLFLTVGPLLIALCVRLAAPPLRQLLLLEYDFDLIPLYPLLMSLVVLMAPSLAGALLGFLLLDERDDRTLDALLITPIPLNVYLLYRLGLPVVLGLLITPLAVRIAGLISVPLPGLLAVSLMGALSGSSLALVLVAFAPNKVVGIATFKIVQGVQALPLAAFFLDMPWQLLAGFVPSYWPLAMYWRLVDGQPAWGFWLMGLAVNLLWLLFLARRYDRDLHGAAG